MSLNGTSVLTVKRKPKSSLSRDPLACLELAPLGQWESLRKLLPGNHIESMKIFPEFVSI